ncbi:hypothetical protein caldi_09380 [Caldinitratiruptor microaerophilus]|uniref:Uncharacterized protein n=1 Tax=Caldinitratiruptor microaerophilus TaxID=671077 RepID=A0AA35CK34_9FIRM|nr:hypothetical protein caldi_09380 [Caldinitratiruptor microaerophilus]
MQAVGIIGERKAITGLTTGTGTAVTLVLGGRLGARRTTLRGEPQPRPTFDVLVSPTIRGTPQFRRGGPGSPSDFGIRLEPWAEAHGSSVFSGRIAREAGGRPAVRREWP